MESELCKYTDLFNENVLCAASGIIVTCIANNSGASGLLTLFLCRFRLDGL